MADDLTGTVREKSGVNNGTPGIATATGDLAGTFVVQSNKTKTYGKFSINSAGTWTYTLTDTNAAVQALNTGGTLHDLITVTTTGGTSKVIDITVQGANDAAVITGTSARTVKEKSGVDNGTAGTATASGDLDATDVDNPATFVVQSGVSTSYGTFSIAADGGWTYTLDDDNAAVQALNSGGTLHDLITVTTADGTAKVIDITVQGANDAAVVGGTVTGSVTEKSGVANGTAGVATATGTATVTDVDSATTFVVQNNVAKDYGRFTINAAGAWSYTLDDNNGDVQALNSGGTLHELVTVKTADNTAKVIDITINGANDSATITGAATGSVEEKGGVNNGVAGVATRTGDLNATDVGSATTFTVQNSVAKTYGTFSIASSGAWTYTLNDTNISVQALNDGDTLHELVTIATAVGTTKVTDITINGVADSGMDLTYRTPTLGFVVRGDSGGDQAGFSVSSAGDVNGDGFADFVIGARYGDDGGTKAGEAYVVFGKASGFGTVNGTGRAVVDLTNLAPTVGFIVRGDMPGDTAGRSVSLAGDVNGDGFADLIVGSPGGDDGGTYAGEAYVVFGRASGFDTLDGRGRSVIDLTKLSATDGFIIQGAVAYEAVGFSVSAAGDINGDGFADVIVGTPYASGSEAYFGEAYVIFGKASGFGTVDHRGRPVIDLADLGAADGFIIQGDAADDLAGTSVSSAGDVNGDGFADLIVGAPYAEDGGTESGSVYVLFGGAFGGSTTPVTTTGTAAAEMLIGGLGDDTLTGGGGAGDDNLSVADLTFRSVDGGGGSDTLVLLGSGQNFNLTTLVDNKLSNIETVDITGSGNNSLTLGFADIAAINDGDNGAFTLAGTSHFLVVDGNAGDTLTLQSYDPDGAGGLAAALWTQIAANVGLDGAPGGGYNIYDLARGSDVLALVAMDCDITKI